MQAKHVEQMAETMEWSAAELDSARATIVGDHVYALVKDDTTLALFGGSQINRGTAHVWSIISTQARAYPHALTKSAIRLLELYQKSCGIHRFEMSIKVGNTKAEVWAQFLGFSCEGRMLKYGPDKSDYWLYGRA